MNTFIDVVFIFIFVFVLLHFKLVNIRNTNIINQKILIFLAVTIFATVLSAMKSIRKQCPVDTWKSVNAGVFTGLFAYIGYTLFYDLFYLPETHPYMSALNETPWMEALIGISIVFAIIVGRGMYYVFTVDDCHF